MPSSPFAYRRPRSPLLLGCLWPSPLGAISPRRLDLVGAWGAVDPPPRARPCAHRCRARRVSSWWWPAAGAGRTAPCGDEGGGAVPRARPRLVGASGCGLCPHPLAPPKGSLDAGHAEGMLAFTRSQKAVLTSSGPRGRSRRAPTYPCSIQRSCGTGHRVLVLHSPGRSHLTSTGPCYMRHSVEEIDVGERRAECARSWAVRRVSASGAQPDLRRFRLAF